MRVQILYAVEADDDTRRAINLHYGRPGLATRAQVKAWYERHGRSMDDDLSRSLEDQEIESDRLGSRQLVAELQPSTERSSDETL